MEARVNETSVFVNNTATTHNKQVDKPSSIIYTVNPFIGIDNDCVKVHKGSGSLLWKTSLFISNFILRAKSLLFHLLTPFYLVFLTFLLSKTSKEHLLYRSSGSLKDRNYIHVVFTKDQVIHK